MTICTLKMELNKAGFLFKENNCSFENDTNEIFYNLRTSKRMHFPNCTAHDHLSQQSEEYTR